ncbi:MAG: succinyldiaminopimelate transaminase [Methylobacter sp.]|uniref:succinyldiaminopimelate transaminase n=1 Tax=Methylobacter sp. TaxID=2051955 RepID=UPI002730A0F0|nr:succinyldiaminopimelate transaminase [Methylobacter sp.]MDP1665653.1 succinyldiaminopimelate transaminase [Methylobacter sp.]MDP1970878.1 succinyldiaminopimelate transaminase [Methylobacter sp.]
MTPNLKHLHPYPFEKLAQLKLGIVPPANKPHIALSMGEPTHATPHLIQEALLTHLHGLANYPTTKGIPELRLAIAEWISRRFQIPADAVNPETQVLPVNGTREALFSFAQCLIDPTGTAPSLAITAPVVIMPNPFYQIYEGAALLAGAEPYFLNTLEGSGYLPDFDAVPDEMWQRCQLIYICSPGNPTGSVINQTSQEKLLNLAEKHDFVIASDECYTEIYDDETNPPPGLLQTAYNMGNTAFKRCVIFHSLSKRSNAPGLRSGFVAGDAEILKHYFQYRTYHGCAMPLPTQHASIQAWQDERHVVENRRLYREKFAAFIDILGDVCTVTKPPASFYVWLKIPLPSASSFEKGGLRGLSDTEFAQQLFAQQNITVLPGSYLSRDFDGVNPGLNHVRIALVAPLDECIEAAHRIKNFLNSL